MTMLLAWVAFPALLAVLSLGCGLLAERAAGVLLPTTLLLPTGYALIVVVAGLTTRSDQTAELTTPLVLALAAAGLGLSLPLKGLRIDGWAIGAAVAVFCAFAAPVVLSGDPTFAGYIKLDDTATWLALTDHVMEHGRNLAGLAPSTYEATLAYTLPAGYPVGAHLPLGIGHQLTSQDSAWLFQPQICFLAALIALSAYELVRPMVRSGWLRALAVFVASQPAILYGYALWGGTKELSASAMVVFMAALVPVFVGQGGSVRGLLPLATAAAATLSMLSFAGGVWLLPVLGAAVLAAHALPARRFLVLAGAFGAAALLFVVTGLGGIRFFRQNVAGASSGLRDQQELGNLIEPLNVLQIFGIWPAGDFRYDPGELELTYLLIALVVAAGALGLALAWRRRSYGLLLFVAAAAAGAVSSAVVGSPWIDAKAFAIASPAFVLVALVAASAIFEHGRRVEAIVVIVFIAGGVMWSNTLAYREAWLAPYDKLSELEEIGKRIANQGPTLMTEYEPYGVRHFLRAADPEGAAELRHRPVPLRNGQILSKGESVDIDQFLLQGLLEYRTLVLRRSPLASRPPSAFRIVREGRFYEVWQRSGNTQIVEHVPLGVGGQPASIPPCEDILRLADRAGPGGRLAAVVRAPASVLPLSAGGPVFLAEQFQFSGTVDLPAAGSYGVWIGNEFRSEVKISVDDRAAGSARHQLKPEQFTPLPELVLSGGRHHLRLEYGGPDLHPGSAGRPWFGLGPVVLSRSTAELPVVYVQRENARSLCGKSLDWVEAVS